MSIVCTVAVQQGMDDRRNYVQKIQQWSMHTVVDTARGQLAWFDCSTMLQSKITSLPKG
jgi:hypothetical protein